MVDAIVSLLLDQLKSIAEEEVKDKWRLVTGVEHEVKKLTSNLQAIQALLDDAEQRQVKDKAVRQWLDQLKDASYDMEDVLDEWITARLKLQIEGGDDDDNNAFVNLLTKVCSLFPTASNCFGSFKQVSLRHDIAVKIKEINEKLEDIATQKDRFKFVENASTITRKPERVPTTSLIDEGKVCGRVNEKNELLSKLLCESSEQQNDLHIISLVGMGGIGKTTLAQLVCNNDEVKRMYEKIIWVCVSDNFEESQVARAIIEAIDETTCSLEEFQSRIAHIRKSIEGKKFFLVLDDVWDGDFNKWEPFYCCLNNGLCGSKILITTRNESVAHMMGSTDIISIKELAERECWSLFKQIAFFNRSFEECEKLEETGRKIARKCKGLPLAAKTMGSLLRSKKTVDEWQRILDSEMWRVEEIEKGLLAPLLLSYNDLPSMVKRCLSYCAIFPKDYHIDKEELITLWMAQGYLNVEEDQEMEMVGEEYFNILATRSFFQEFNKDTDNIISCRIHDIVHDFCQYLSKNECFSVEIDGSEELLTNSFEKICHSMITLREGASFPVSICEIKRFRSLLIRGYVDYSRFNSNDLLPELFGELTCLRALDISNNSFTGNNLIKEIPPNLGTLIHLRYLNLSGQFIERLPESLCELYNLHKLDVSFCIKLRELPSGIGKLVNLSSLLNEFTDSLRYMPIGISRLTSLRILQKIVLGGRVDDSKPCSTVESLKKLQLLRDCRISGLGNVTDVGEAKRSELYKKKNLLFLRLQFDAWEDDEEEGRRKNEEDEQLLEALQPPPKLKVLWIWLYRGKVFPNWLISLTNLRDLTLGWCKKCEHLPPLGKLPSLEKLFIWGLKSVKRVGNEFLGIESTSSSSSLVIAFPKLISLEIWGMDELEEWDYRSTRKGNTIIMPRLSSLQIESCPKLKVLPDYLLQMTTLQELKIYFCPILEERLQELMTGLR